MRRQLLILTLPFTLACTGALAWLTQAESALNAACAELHVLPDQSAVCAGIQGAEVLANLIVAFVESRNAPTLKRAMLRTERAPKLTKVNGLPYFARPDVAAMLNDPKVNAELIAFVTAGLTDGGVEGGAK